MIHVFFKRASASNMAILGIYVKFQGGMMYLGIMRSPIMPLFWDLILANQFKKQMGLITFGSW